jgi:glycosyltransferase involved in cell wall biosynthesis
MKVLFISSWYPSSINHLKGIYVKKHAAAIKSAGVDIEILALTINPSEKWYEKKVYSFLDESGIKTHMIELNSKYYKLLYVNLFFQFTLIKRYFKKSILSSFKPDLIHSNVLFPAAILGHWLCAREKLPHMITEHWSKVDKFMSRNIYAAQGKKAYNGARKVTAVSGFLNQSLAKYLDDKDKIVVVPNVVNTKVFTFKEKVLAADRIVFTCAAHWGLPKRPDLIFNALQSIRKKTTKAIVLNVVGEGRLLEDLKLRSWDFQVNYVGNLPAAGLALMLHSSNYFLHASEMETFSIVIAEALSTGTPVLASDVGAIPELINEANGLVVTNSTEDWERGLQKLMSIDAFNGELIANQVQKFSENAVGEKFYAIYKEVLNKG